MFHRMRRILAPALLALSLVFGGCATFPASPLNMAKLTVFERMVNSVVILPGCTGIVLENNGKDSVILTAAHCVRRFKVALPDGKEVLFPIPVGTGLAKDALCLGKIGSVATARDLAIITVEKCELPTTVAPLAKSPPKFGDVAYAVGHPLSSNYVLTKGIVSRPITMYDDSKYLLVSAPIVFGNSGGPCFNRSGELIGVVTEVGAVKVRMEDGKSFPLWAPVSHLGLAVPLDEVKQFLKVAGFARLAK